MCKKVIEIMFIGLLVLSGIAYGNEVRIVANQPMKVSFRIVQQYQHQHSVLGALETVEIDDALTIPIHLNNYDIAGLTIISINGHELPAFANQFNKSAQCSMTTDKIKSKGSISLSLSTHKIRCRSEGGVFG